MHVRKFNQPVKYMKALFVIIAFLSLTSCGKAKLNNANENTGDHIGIDENIEKTGSDELDNRTSSIMEQETMNSDSAFEDTDYDTPAEYAVEQEGRQYGLTEDVTYYSSTVGRDRLATVMLPANYDTNKEYPVLYVLGGWGGGREMWVDICAATIAQNAHYDYGTPEMIVVSPTVFTSSSGESQDGLSFTEAAKGYDQFINDLEDDLMPYINSHYSVKSGPENTAIAGLSLGGREAVYIGMLHPEQFGYIAGFSTTGGLFSKSPWADALLSDFDLNSRKDTYRYILLSIGDEDPYLDSALEYNQAFDQNGIQYSYYMTSGGHEPTVWQQGLYNFVRRLF